MTTDHGFDEPAGTTPAGPDEPRLSFGQAVSRGFTAANSTLLGALLIFLILAPQQIAAVASMGMMSRGALNVPPGGEPPPEFFMLMGIGCLTCGWLLVVVFALPWVTGGVLGQIRDRVISPGGPVGPLRVYGGRYYVRMLLMMVILIVLVIAVYSVSGIVTSILVGTPQMQPGQFDVDAMRETARHPVSIAANVMAALVLTVLSLVWNLAYAAIAVEDAGAATCFSRSFAFCGERGGSAARLFLLLLAVNAPMHIVPQLGNILKIEAMGWYLAVGVFLSLYIAYATVLNLGFSVSLYLAQRPGLAGR